MPDARNFIRDLETDLKRRKAEFAVQVSADTKRAYADIEKFRVAQERDKINLKVDVDTSSAERSLSKLFGGSGGGGGGGFGGGGGRFGFLTGPIGIPLIFTGIGELPAATTAITNVVGALQQLSGAGAAIPGILGGIVSEVGTVKLAMTGVEDAFKAVEKASDGSAKNIAAANEALAKLAPQAADFVRQVTGLKPAFDDLTKGVQGKFFQDLGKSVHDLATADLPVLTKGLGGIATALNGSLKQIGISLSSNSSQGLLDRIFGNTAEAQARLTAAIDPLIKGIGTLTAAGTDVLPRLADDVGKVAERFSAFISEADQNGTLDKFINDGITGVEQLGSTFVNVGKIINDITSAAGGGGGLLKFLDEGSQKLHDFLSSTEGQNQLKTWFEEGRREIQEHIIPLLQALPGFFEGLYNAGRTIADTVIPPLRDISQFLSEHPHLIEAVAEAFLAWKFVSVITDVSTAVRGIGTAFGVIGPASAAAGAAGVAGLAPLVAAIAAITVGLPALMIATHPVDVPERQPGESLDDWLNRVKTAGVPLPAQNPVPPKPVPTDPSLIGAPPVLPPPDPRNVQGPVPGAGDPFAPGGALGGNTLPPRKIGPGYDKGGVLPGYSPGKDNMLGSVNGRIFGLAGGEGIIRPEVVKQVGPDFIHGLNNGFDTGGILPGGQARNGPDELQRMLMSWGLAKSGIAIQPGNFNPNMLLDTSTTTVSPPPKFGDQDKSSYLFGDVAKHGVSGGKIGKGIPFHNKKFDPLGYDDGDPARDPGNNIWNLPGFATGAVIDQWGNPVNPGTAPGPVAPNPSGGGGISGIAGSFLSGLGGPLGQLTNFISGQMGGQGGGQSGSKGLTPGFAGLAQAGSDPNKLDQWGLQTGDWLGKFGAKTALSFGTTLFQGALGLVGLENSILSPTNSWNQAAQQTAGFFLGQDGPLGQGDASSLPGGVMPQTADGSSPGAGRAIEFAQTHALGQKYKYGGVGNGGYDCSGIASAIYAAAKGLPEGQRYFTTESDFTRLGFIPGYQPGALNVGIRRGGGGRNSHMALTLPNGVNVESGGSSGTTRYGGDASGATSDQFGLHYYLPLDGKGAGAIPGLYDSGGWLMPGLSLNASKKPEPVLTAEEGSAYKQMAQAAVANTKNPRPDVPDARTKQPQAASPLPTSPNLPAPAAQSPQQQPAFTSPTPTGGANPSVDSHTLPAISKGITSGFATAGALAQQAASFGMMAATAGASAVAGGGGGGGMGGISISGMFQQAGKIANDIADVGSAFLVGNVTPGTQESQYGSLMRPAQKSPQTAMLDQGRTYVFNDTHSDRIVDQMRVKDSQDRQAALAQWGG